MITNEPTRLSTPERIVLALNRVADVCRIAELTRREREQIDMDLNLLRSRFQQKPETQTEKSNP